MGIDLGTYHVRVELENGEGFIESWPTGGRFIGGGAYNILPLTATWEAPLYDDEQDLLSSIEFMFYDGNYACDCNKGLSIAQSKQLPDPCVPCGDTLKIKRLTIYRPDGSETLLNQEECNG